MKYPRTYHLPFSPGATKDDRMLQDGWFDDYKGKEVVITEKLDGENTCMTRYNVYSRSHGAPTRTPWSANLWDNDGLFWKVKDYIGAEEAIYGENLYGEHSIHYDNLQNYFFMFAAANFPEDESKPSMWYSWSDVELLAYYLQVPTVPVLWKGVFKDETEVEAKVNELMLEPSAFGKTKEGIVMRVASEFPILDFSKNVCKWVRPNHVQTDEHWTKNWKKSTLNFN
jgi:hypothetical protein